MKIDHAKLAKLTARLSAKYAATRGVRSAARDERDSLAPSIAYLSGNRGLAKHWEYTAPVADILKLPAELLGDLGVDVRAVHAVIEGQARTAELQADAERLSAECDALARVVANCQRFAMEHAA